MTAAALLEDRASKSLTQLTPSIAFPPFEGCDQPYMERSTDSVEQIPEQAPPEEPCRADEGVPAAAGAAAAARTQNCSFYMRTGTCAYVSGRWGRELCS